MDIYSAKLRIATILVGILIALLAAFIVLGVATYFFNIASLFSTLTFILAFVLVLDIVQWLLGPYIIGMTFRTKKVDPNDTQLFWLQDMIERVSAANNVRTPTLYISEIAMPNAFAYSSPVAGRRIAVTRGALNILDRDELEAVVGHEVGHLKHRDVELLMAIGLIPTILFYLGYMLMFSGMMEDRNGGIFVIFAILLIIVSFIFNLMILGINRMRESYADINAAKTVPGGAGKLQTALAKIVISSSRSYRKRAGRAVRPTDSNFFANMLLFSGFSEAELMDPEQLVNQWKTTKLSRFAGMFSDHPHPAKRIQLLEKYKNQF
ncbi:MAG TPA: zinc metalloprotease HtpX [Thermoplasmataceae archaeon]|nr:zinc metalloprotease HtpX [Thermoplasmataceae archaeon]